MKKIVILLVVFTLAIFAGCKKKAEPAPPPPPPPPPKISVVDYLLSLGERTEVKNLSLGDSLVLNLDPAVVDSPSSQSVVVKRFNAELNYNELLALLKKIPLTVVWVSKEGSQLLIRDYLDLQDYYSASETFRILEPMPAYSLKIDEKEYWVGKEGKFWKTW